MTQANTVRIAAVGDIHCTKSSQGALAPLFQYASEHADVLALAGDLCDYGLPEEARVLVKELANAKVPVVAVLGNHDFESGKPQEVVQILCEAGVHVLDGDSVELAGVGFAGVKGFGGGFGRRALGPWGEESIKLFVREAVGEALKLESALARLRTPHKVALMHYAPIEATVVNEPLEIYPFLGSSRLEEPLSRYPVSVVLHGHAHHGSPEGSTANGTPVYNVSMPLMRLTLKDGTPPLRIVELPAASTAPAPAANGHVVGAMAGAGSA